jgi:hypothetical protein
MVQLHSARNPTIPTAGDREADTTLGAEGIEPLHRPFFVMNFLDPSMRARIAQKTPSTLDMMCCIGWSPTGKELTQDCIDRHRSNGH